MDYQEVLKNAKGCMGEFCKACDVCNGKACRNQIPGPGAKGSGDGAIRNFDAWKSIRINMDTLCGTKQVNTTLKLFNQTFKYPFFAGPVGALNLHYSDKYNDLTYNTVLLKACANAGIAALTGDGTNAKVMEMATGIIKEIGGIGIPTVKPWNIETVLKKLELVRASNSFAVAMDVDAAGLPFLKNMNPPAGGKSMDELRTIIDQCHVPFIVKGVMTTKGALKAKTAGASAIVVSNHGGRVLDQCLATAEVLSEIADVVGDTMKIFVDGGIRSGTDIFKALALGADGVLICRPFVTAVYGGGEDGVKTYIEKLGSELEDTMAMCGAYNLDGISKDMVRVLPLK